MSMETLEENAVQKDPAALSHEKQELLDLEKTGTYVFHGTAKDLKTLEPQQAVDTEKGPDGNPAIFASDRAEYAIFMAILNGKNCPGGSHTRAGARTNSKTELSELAFGATQETLNRLRESASGFVYVFDKKDFTQRAERPVEYMSHTPVTALYKIQVTRQDLPTNIRVFD